MVNTNIILAGVGGQGLVMTTKIIAEAAYLSGLDVKTNDVVGLSQRGGKVWGSVRLGEKVFSPNVRPGEVDILLGFEALEGRRFRKELKKDSSVAIVNKYQMVPTLVQQGKEEYATDIEEELNKYAGKLIYEDFTQKAVELGNKAAANIVLLGACSVYVKDIPEEKWVESIVKSVPPKFVELNKEAFALGRKLAK
ncbi:indolepyruvate oxidoreductase subunit beta [Peptostreptococcus equinus]|uniref:Indolepyruvate oxidoreductase subunit beta n=1 Tax=Peptostreptococcus equinus TaxID=3003601 RepID=A0ABY7JT21_9FIRM|nr:indolepyruvate oxidoreductase subunit beta [Peptostreptococcus sp. CBA3647]WAW14857.1 indolepyruvate oxidoreductase subunit beta [Peptostreptococcus sp. CBA3647]